MGARRVAGRVPDDADGLDSATMLPEISVRAEGEVVRIANDRPEYEPSAYR
jgi:hypothetical protein